MSKNSSSGGTAPQSCTISPNQYQYPVKVCHCCCRCPGCGRPYPQPIQYYPPYPWPPTIYSTSTSPQATYQNT